MIWPSASLRTIITICSIGLRALGEIKQLCEHTVYCIYGQLKCLLYMSGPSVQVLKLTHVMSIINEHIQEIERRQRFIVSNDESSPIL